MSASTSTTVRCLFLCSIASERSQTDLKVDQCPLEG
jgi:hypothetical protein